MNYLKIVSVFLFTLSIISKSFAQSRPPISANRFQILSGKRKANDVKGFWDKKYSERDYIYGKAPAMFLAQNYEFLPKNGKVLDMGMGEGRNAVFLAGKGFKVTGVDISSVAVKKARALAREYDVRVGSVVASLNTYKVSPGSFDAIISFYYVDRKLHKKMLRWLKPGGILIYEAFTDKQQGIKNKKYKREHLLRPGELLGMFKGYAVLKFEEPIHNDSFTASIILKKN